MTASELVIETQGLAKSYGSRPVLHGIDLRLERGETLALLGPNGAGKSSTIEILEGYRDRSGGSVSVLGVDPRRGSLGWKARLGIVLQSGGEAGAVTVREQLRQFAGYYPHPRDVGDLIEAVGLEEKADTLIKNLSGGQRRRVDVALGVIGRPELLFLDEPTTGFDPEARRRFWELILGLKAEGTSILLTTHYLDEAAQLSDRVAVIAGGRLIEEGTAATLGGHASRVPLLRWREEGRMREERTTEPAARVRELAERLGAEPEELEVIRPSLEDVYLRLIAEADAADHDDHDSREVAA